MRANLITDSYTNPRGSILLSATCTQVYTRSRGTYLKELQVAFYNKIFESIHHFIRKQGNIVKHHIIVTLLVKV